MQEEVTQRTVALCVEATKLSAGMLQQAMKKVLDEMQKGVTGHKTKLHHGIATTSIRKEGTPHEKISDHAAGRLLYAGSFFYACIGIGVSL